MFGAVLKLSAKLQKRRVKRQRRLQHVHSLVQREGGKPAVARKVAGYLLTELLADTVLVFEAVVTSMLGYMLLLILILVLLISTIFTGLLSLFGSVFTLDAEGLTSSAVNINIGASGGAESYSNYDWYGNMSNNLLKLSDTDKEIYQLITCNMELEKYASEDKEGIRKSWNAAVGVGMLYGEMAGGLSRSTVNYHTDTDEERDILINDKLNYPYQIFSMNTTADGLGDGPAGICWENATKGVDYSFGHWSLNTLKHKEWLQENIEWCVQNNINGGVRYTMEQAYAIWTIVGSCKWAYYNNRSIDFDYNAIGKDDFICGTQFDRWGVAKTKENLSKITALGYYAIHHGCGSEDRAYVIEYALALYKYANEDFANVYLVDANGKPAPAVNAHPVYKEFLYGTYPDASSSLNICVVHDGVPHIFDYESGDSIAKCLLEWAKKTNSKRYATLKEALEWGDDKAPYFIGSYDSAGRPIYNSTYSSNLCNCMGVFMVGQSLIKDIATKCGITLKSTSTGGTKIASSATQGDTQTAKNVAAVATELYEKHGINSEDAWTAGHNQLLNADGTPNYDYGNAWCCMFVNTVLNTATIGKTDKTVASALRSLTGNRIPSGADASMGYCPLDTTTQRLYYWNGSADTAKSTADITTENGAVIVHYMGNGVFSGAVNKNIRDEKGLYSYETPYVPKAGDIIIWGNTASAYAHVGLVVENATGAGVGVATIEGNTNNSHIDKYSSRTDAVIYIEINYKLLESKFQ